MKNSPPARCISVTKSGARCSLKCAPWGDGNLCRTHFHHTPAFSNEALADWIRDATEHDPERLKQVASLLLDLAAAPRPESSSAPKRDATEGARARRTDEDAARGWARFQQKLQKVSSYVGAQGLAEAIPRDARERERTFHVHLGRFIQTRVVPDAATAEERTELEVLLLRLSNNLPTASTINALADACSGAHREPDARA